MIDGWYLFSLLKPFVDIIVQTYIETLREHPEEKSKIEAWKSEEITESMRL